MVAMEKEEERKRSRAKRDRGKPYLSAFFICRDLFRCVHREERARCLGSGASRVEKCDIP